MLGLSRLSSVLASLLLLIGCSCGGGSHLRDGGGEPDAGQMDAGGLDAGMDAGPPDAGPPDAGPPDAGPPDTGCADADGDGVCDEEDLCPGLDDRAGSIVPTHRWSLDAPSGGLYEDAVGSLDGAAVGAPETGDGPIDGAARLDGSGQYVRFEDVLDQGSRSFSVQAWFFPTEAVAFRKILNKGCTNNGTPRNAGYQLRVRDGELELAIVGAGDIRARAATPAPSLLEWHHAAGVIDREAGEVRLYLDGVEVDVAPIPAEVGSIDTNIPFAIGALDRGAFGAVTEHWSGLLDEVAVFDRALDACEVARAHRRGLDGLPLPSL